MFLIAICHVLRTDEALVMTEELQVKYLATDTHTVDRVNLTIALWHSHGQRGQAHMMKQRNKNTYNSSVILKTTCTAK